MKRTVSLLLSCAIAASSPTTASSTAPPTTCELGRARPLPTSHDVPEPANAYELADGSVVFRGHLSIDADGSPRAYHPQSALGQDRLGNGGVPGNWWAIATNRPDCGPSGTPIIQGAHDPAPGFYVSTTSLQRAGVSCRSPSKYVDASTIPYVALSPAMRGSFLASEGHLAIVRDTRTNHTAFAIFADGGPRTGRGEGSMALAQALGLNPDARHGGASARELVFLVLPAGIGFPTSRQQIEDAGHAAFRDWGDEQRLAACAVRLDAVEHR